MEFRRKNFDDKAEYFHVFKQEETATRKTLFHNLFACKVGLIYYVEVLKTGGLLFARFNYDLLCLETSFIHLSLPFLHFMTENFLF